MNSDLHRRIYRASIAGVLVIVALGVTPEEDGWSRLYAGLFGSLAISSALLAKDNKR